MTKQAVTRRPLIRVRLTVCAGSPGVACQAHARLGAFAPARGRPSTSARSASLPQIRRQDGGLRFAQPGGYAWIAVHGRSPAPSGGDPGIRLP